jgi:hypothetical protein
MEVKKLPKELEDYIGAESIEFGIILKDENNKSNLYVLGIITSLLYAGILIPTFWFVKNLITGDLMAMNPDMSITTTLMFLAILIIVNGLLILFIRWIVTIIFKSNSGYFIGTNQRIIHYLDNEVQSISWDELTGNSDVDIEKNSISLELRKGDTVRIDTNTNSFIHNSLRIKNIKSLLHVGNLHEVAKICKMRAES